MISLNTETHRFNLQGAMAIVQGDPVFLHRLDGGNFWIFSGDRVEPGEHAAQTVVREMQEKIGAPI